MEFMVEYSLKVVVYENSITRRVLLFGFTIIFLSLVKKTGGKIWFGHIVNSMGATYGFVLNNEQLVW